MAIFINDNSNTHYQLVADGQVAPVICPIGIPIRRRPISIRLLIRREVAAEYGAVAANNVPEAAMVHPNMELKGM